MKPSAVPCQVPSASQISRQLEGAYFYDCYALPVAPRDAAATALELYLSVVAQTPSWVNRLMAVRNRVVKWVGLKDLGNLNAVATEQTKPASSYKVGDRVGIFSILQLSDAELVLGDSDKHLDVKLSVFKHGAAPHEAMAVTTVVHIHNALGRAYMLFVTPVHKLIVPAMLARYGARA
jgi:Protein of unknown function (DUF2867)